MQRRTVTILCLSLFLSLTGYAPLAMPDDAFKTPSMSPDDLSQRQNTGHGPLVVDVRGQSEYRSGHVPGAINIAPEKLTEHLAELRGAEGVVLYCSNGSRTRIAEQVLIDNKVPNLFHLEGGVFGWRNGGHPLTTGWAP